MIGWKIIRKKGGIAYGLAALLAVLLLVAAMVFLSLREPKDAALAPSHSSPIVAKPQPAEIAKDVAEQSTEEQIEASAQSGEDRVETIQRQLTRLSGTSATDQRLEAARPLIEEWAQEDPRSALEYVFRKYGWTEEFALALESWCAVSPYEAWNWALELEGFNNFDFLVNVMLNRGKLNAAAALASTVSDDPLVRYEFYDLARVWAVEDPEQAWQWMLTLTDSTLRRVASRGYFETLVPEDHGALAQWVLENLKPDDPARGGALLAVITRWARKGDISDAGEWLNHLPAGAENDWAFAAYAAETAGVDPEAAYTWIASITDEALKNQTLSDVLSLGMINREPEQTVVDWVAQISDQDDRDQAVLAMVRYGLGREHPELAMNMIDDIEQDLFWAYRKIALDWGEVDPGSAIAWVQVDPRLAEGQRLDILTRLNSLEHTQG